jgi:hypothetical protein
MRARAAAPAALLLAALSAGVAAAQTADPMVPVPPVEGVPGPLFFQTPTLSFVPKGTMRVSVGASYLEGVSIPASGLAGDLEKLGLVRVDIGFSSRIEVRVQGTFRDRLVIDEKRSHQVPPSEVTSDTTHDSGDFSVITIARVLPQRGALPALGLRVEAKLPNTDERRGIGTNTTDVILSVPMQDRFGNLLVVADAGLGILTEPKNAQSQNDVLVYGLAVAYAAAPRLPRLGGVGRALVSLGLASGNGGPGDAPDGRDVFVRAIGRGRSRFARPRPVRRAVRRVGPLLLGLPCRALDQAGLKP